MESSDIDVAVLADKEFKQEFENNFHEVIEESSKKLMKIKGILKSEAITTTKIPVIKLVTT